MVPLVIVSFEYGLANGAEGICTARLVESLREACDVQVITVRRKRRLREPGVEDSLPSIACRPTRVQATLGWVAFRMPVAGWDWAIRVGRLRGRRIRAVYGRANPLVSLFAAERLAKRCGAPLILHFSDPIPCPWEDLRANGTRRLVLSVSKLLRSAALLTFTTPEAMAYAEGIYGCGIPARSVLVPNITPAWDDGRGLGGSAGRRELVYVGSFGGARQPDTLLEGLAVHNQMHPGESLGLALVGTQRAYAARATAVLRGRADVRWVPWTEEVMPHYAGARIAAVVDADDAQPVFLASKTLEAIHAARRVLIVSPDGSPARRLFDHRFRSVVFAHHRPEEVASQIRRLDALLDGEAHAEQRARREALTDFRGPQVASALVAALRQVGI